MLEFIVDSSSPLARIQENTDNFNTDFGYKIADPTVILPAVKEVKPLLLEAMRLPSLGDAELDEEWNSYMAGLDRAMENLEKAFAAGNKYGESDYLMAALDLSLYATYVEGFIEKLGDRING
jgi:hypothetical protein